MIKAIFFDAFGTLFHLRGTVGEHYAAAARELGVEIPGKALDAAFVQAWDNLPPRPAIDCPRENDDKPWWRDLVSAVLDQIASVPTDFDRERFFELAYAHFTEPGVWTLHADVEETLPGLARDLQLGIISNFDGRLRTILRHLGIAHFFRYVFISSELGADKPDPKIFRRALARSGLHAGEAVHVGDDPERDWEAAAYAGMHVFKLDRAKNSLRDLPEIILKKWVGRDSNPQPTP
jgi:putative hydrolase of the HAD superfamily